MARLNLDVTYTTTRKRDSQGGTRVKEQTRLHSSPQYHTNDILTTLTASFVFLVSAATGVIYGSDLTVKAKVIC